MQQIFCPTCGTSLAPAARFCGNWGKSVDAARPAPKANSTEPVTAKAASDTQPVTEPVTSETSSATQETASPTVNLKPISTEKLDPAPPESAAVMKRYQAAYQIARLTDM